MNIWINAFVIFIQTILGLYKYKIIYIPYYYPVGNSTSRQDHQQRETKALQSFKKTKMLMEFYGKISPCCCVYLCAVGLLWWNSHAVPTEKAWQKISWVRRESWGWLSFFSYSWLVFECSVQCSGRDCLASTLQAKYLHISRSQALHHRDANLSLAGEGEHREGTNCIVPAVGAILLWPTEEKSTWELWRAVSYGSSWLSTWKQVWRKRHQGREYNEKVVLQI